MMQRAHAVNPDWIKRFPLFRNLPHRVQAYVLGQAHVAHHNAGSEIAHPGSESGAVYFLLRGEVRITDTEGTQTLFEADREYNFRPLTAASPRLSGIVACSEVELLSLPLELFEAINRLPSQVQKGSGKAIELTDYSGPEADLYWEFHEAILEERMELPSMPDITLRIARTVHAPNSDSHDIARVIEADPAVAGRIISVVNSAAYRGRELIDNVPDAVTRLGRNATHNLIISFALGKLFHSRSQPLQHRMKTLWHHLSYVAPICHELARLTPGLEPEKALLCGLLHDIGALAILGAASGKPELSENPALLDRITESLKAEVGAMVLRKWGFPDAFVQAALHAEDWLEEISEEPDYTDLVVVAQLHAYVGTPRMQSLPRLDLVPAFHKLALGQLTPRYSIAILERARDWMQELRQLLAI